MSQPINTQSSGSKRLLDLSPPQESNKSPRTDDYSADATISELFSDFSWNEGFQLEQSTDMEDMESGSASRFASRLDKKIINIKTEVDEIDRKIAEFLQRKSLLQSEQKRLEDLKLQSNINEFPIDDEFLDNSVQQQEFFSSTQPTSPVLSARIIVPLNELDDHQKLQLVIVFLKQCLEVTAADFVREIENGNIKFLGEYSLENLRGVYFEEGKLNIVYNGFKTLNPDPRVYKILKTLIPQPLINSFLSVSEEESQIHPTQVQTAYRRYLNYELITKNNEYSSSWGTAAIYKNGKLNSNKAFKRALQTYFMFKAALILMGLNLSPHIQNNNDYIELLKGMLDGKMSTSGNKKPKKDDLIKYATDRLGELSLFSNRGLPSSSDLMNTNIDLPFETVQISEADLIYNVQSQLKLDELTNEQKIQLIINYLQEARDEMTNALFQSKILAKYTLENLGGANITEQGDLSIIFMPNYQLIDPCPKIKFHSDNKKTSAYTAYIEYLQPDAKRLKNFCVKHNNDVENCKGLSNALTTYFIYQAYMILVKLDVQNLNNPEEYKQTLEIMLKGEKDKQNTPTAALENLRTRLINYFKGLLGQF